MPTTLNKPPGLPVFPPHADPTGDCLLLRLLADQPWRKDVAFPPGFAGGIAHRLDTATSGAVLVADSLDELTQFRAWFATHAFTKTYLMLAAKDVPWDRNVCVAPIAHHPDKRNRMVVQRGKNTPHRGKWYPAHTEFRRLRLRPRKGGAASPLPPGARALWEVTITTGVMHQIRVHAAFLGIPILGDRLYGGGPPQLPVGFYLHHTGLTGPSNFRTTPVPPPPWASR